MNWRKIGWTAVAIGIGYYILTSPTGAAALGHNIFGVIKQAGHSLTVFLNGLSG